MRVMRRKQHRVMTSDGVEHSRDMDSHRVTLSEPPFALDMKRPEEPSGPPIRKRCHCGVAIPRARRECVECRS